MIRKRKINGSVYNTTKKIRLETCTDSFAGFSSSILLPKIKSDYKNNLFQIVFLFRIRTLRYHLHCLIFPNIQLFIL